MSGDWYFMRRRWIGGAKKVGPITDHDLSFGSIKVKSNQTRYC